MRSRSRRGLKDARAGPAPSRHSSLGLLLALRLSCRVLSSVISVRVLRTHRTWEEPCRDAVRSGHALCGEDGGLELCHARTTMARALSSRGAENTMEMNMPLESKYWYFENNLFQERFKDYGASQHGVLVILCLRSPSTQEDEVGAEPRPHTMATSVPLRGDPPNPVGDDPQALQGHCGPHASSGRAPGEGDTGWPGQAAPSVPLSGGAGHELYVTDSATVIALGPQ